MCVVLSLEAASPPPPPLLLLSNMPVLGMEQIEGPCLSANRFRGARLSPLKKVWSRVICFVCEAWHFFFCENKAVKHFLDFILHVASSQTLSL